MARKSDEELVTAAYTMPPDLKQKIADLAWERRQHASELVRVALAEYLERQREPAPVS